MFNKLLKRILILLLTLAGMGCGSNPVHTTTRTAPPATASSPPVHTQPKHEQQDTGSGGFATYGNWCGRNHPKNINTAAAPVDHLDTTCKQHDLCYIKYGDFDCACDRALVKEIDKAQIHHLYSKKELFVARGLKAHFALSPCNGNTTNNKMLPTRVLMNIYKGTKRKAKALYKKFFGDSTPNPAPKRSTSSKSATANNRKSPTDPIQADPATTKTKSDKQTVP